MSAATITSGRARRPCSHVWLPGTTSVAPFSAVKLFSAITEANSATFEGVKRLVLAWGVALASLVVALTVRDVRRLLRMRQARVAA